MAYDLGEQGLFLVRGVSHEDVTATRPLTDEDLLPRIEHPGRAMTVRAEPACFGWSGALEGGTTVMAAEVFEDRIPLQADLVVERDEGEHRARLVLNVGSRIPLLGDLALVPDDDSGEKQLVFVGAAFAELTLTRVDLSASGVRATE
jgi:hypothetical protein